MEAFEVEELGLDALVQCLDVCLVVLLSWWDEAVLGAEQVADNVCEAAIFLHPALHAGVFLPIVRLHDANTVTCAFEVGEDRGGEDTGVCLAEFLPEA